MSATAQALVLGAAVLLMVWVWAPVGAACIAAGVAALALAG